MSKSIIVDKDKILRAERRGEKEKLRKHRDRLEALVKERTKELADREANLKHVLEANELGTWALNIKTSKAWRSLRHDQIFGYKKLLPEWTYKMFLKHVLPEDRKKVNDTFGQALSKGRKWDFECRILRHDGQVRWIWAQGKPKFDTGKKIEMMVGLVKDITEQKRAQQENAHLAAFPLNSPDPIIELDEAGRITFVNPATKEALNRIRAGDKVSLFIPFDFRRIRRALAGGRKKTFLREVHIKDSIFLETIAVIPALKVIRIYTNDITVRKNIENQLHKQGEELQTMIDASPAFIFFKDKQNRFIRVNNAFAESCGIPRKKLEGLSCFDVFPKEEADKYWHDDLKVVLDGKPVRNIIETMRIKDKSYWLRTDKIPYVDAQGNIVGVIGFAIDITGQLLAEDKLKKTLEGLEEQVKERTDELEAANIKLIQEIEERKSVEAELSSRGVLLRLLAKSASRRNYIDGLVKLIQGWSRCANVGIRLLNEQGNIPYESYLGFSQDFWEQENCLSVSQDRCICTRVLEGKPGPRDELLAMTAFGSFRCNDTMQFLDRLSEKEKTCYRAVCMKYGFSSVAVIPIKHKDMIVGLIHLADTQPGMVGLEKIEQLEKLVSLIGEGLHKFNLEDKIHKDHATLEAFFTHAVTPLVFLDPDFNFIRVNQAYAAACKKEVGEFIGHNHFEFYQDHENEAIFRQVVTTQTPYKTFGRPFLFPDHPEWGVTYWDWTLVPIVNQDNKVEFLVFSLNDVTEQRRAMERLQSAEKELTIARRLADIGTLAATVAHELRNPLAAVRMAAYNIKRKAQNPLLDKHLDNIDVKISESEQIINNLLFYARLKEPSLGQVGLYSVLNDCIGDIAGSLPKHKVKVVRKFRGLKGITIEADQLQMTELFSNILSNACDAVPDKGAAVEIIGVVLDSAFVQVIIKDNGSGIDESHRDKIFEPFFSTKAKGTGLGLTVCDQIVKLHNGTIDIESRQGKGTTVRVTLPVARTQI